MNTLRVPFERLVTDEDNIFRGAAYQGLPFTGVAVEDTKYFHAEYRYENGMGEGRCFSVYPDGSPHEEFFLHGGEHVGDSRTWYLNGQMRELSNQDGRRYWSESGILLLHRDEIGKEIKEYYESGELKKRRALDGYFSVYSLCFDKDGTWLFISGLRDEGCFPRDIPRQEAVRYHCPARLYAKIPEDVKDGRSMYAETLFFHGGTIRERFEFLCGDYDFCLILLYWVRRELERSREDGMRLLSIMLAHENPQVKDSAIIFAGGLHIHEALPLLEKALQDCRVPPSYVKPYENGGKSWTRTIAQQAAYAIKTIRDSSHL